MQVLSIVLPLMLLLTMLAPVRALAWSENPTTPEGWAWNQIKEGNSADFNEHCGVTLDPHKADGWDDRCRQIPSQFLVDVLTMPRWQNQVTRRGIRLRGAHVVEDIDLSNAEIVSEVWLNASLVNGGLNLTNAHLKRRLSFDGSVLDGALSAEQMDAESLITLCDHSTFAGEVLLRGAKVGGSLKVETASFSKTLNADRLDVHGDLFMRDHSTFTGDVLLLGAKVGGSLKMENAHFSKTLNADRLDVHGDLFMRDHAAFAGKVLLRGAKVGGNFDMETAHFSKTLNADRLDVHGDLFMRDHAAFTGKVLLRGAKVGGNFDMETAFFSNALSADRLDVHGDLFIRDHSTFTGDVLLLGAKVGGNLDMQTASFSNTLDADGLDVHGYLFMRNQMAFAGNVLLRRATVGSLYLNSATVASIDLSDISGAAGSELTLIGLNWRCGKSGTEGENSRTSQAAVTEGKNKWRLGDPSRRKPQCDGTVESLPTLRLRNTYFAALQDDRDSCLPYWTSKDYTMTASAGWGASDLPTCAGAPPSNGSIG